MQNSVVMVTIFDFTQEIYFLSNFDSKKQNCQCNLEIPSTNTNLNTQN